MRWSHSGCPPKIAWTGPGVGTYGCVGVGVFTAGLTPDARVASRAVGVRLLVRSPTGTDTLVVGRFSNVVQEAPANPPAAHASSRKRLSCSGKTARTAFASGAETGPVLTFAA